MDDTKTYTLAGQPIMLYKHIANEYGWNMIGGCLYSARAFSDNCSINVIYGYVPMLGYKRVLKSENLEPGEGYWIRFIDITDQAELRVESIIGMPSITKINPY